MKLEDGSGPRDTMRITRCPQLKRGTVKSSGDAVVAVVAPLLIALISASGCSQAEQPAQQDASQRPAQSGDFGEADGVAPLTVLTPSGAKLVQGEVSYPEVFGRSVALGGLHAVLLGKYTGKSFNVQALIDTGESLPFAALQLVAQAADPSSVPIVAKLAAGPDKRMRTRAAEAMGRMGKQNASLRKPIEGAVKTTLRPNEGMIPDWLAKAFRQPLLLHQDAIGAVHIDGEPHDLDSVRKLLREHVRKTGDHYVTVSRSPRTPDAAGNKLNLLIQRELGILAVVEEEIKALRDVGRTEQAKELEDQYEHDSLETSRTAERRAKMSRPYDSHEDTAASYTPEGFVVVKSEE